MLKRITLIALIAIFYVACQNDKGNSPAISSKNSSIDSLQQLIALIKPGLGECMMQVEYHYHELGKALTVNNLGRANYELDELDEIFEKTKLMHNNHDKFEGKTFENLHKTFMETPISDLRKALESQKMPPIKAALINLKTNCNSCHAANKMPFIVVE